MENSFLKIFVIALCFCSCEKKRVILYEYNGVYVTRIDEGTESHFYYGKYKNSRNLPSSFVKSTFSGFNSGMDAYLIFKPSNVDVYYSMDYFVNIGSAKNIEVINNTLREFNFNFDDSVRGKYNNVCRVSDILSREQELNTKNNSKVIITYP